MVVWSEAVAGAPASGREADFDPTPGPSLCILRAKAGDRLAIPVEFVDDGTDAVIPLVSSNWAAHVRVRPSSEKVCEFTVDATNKATGLLILRMEPEQSALMRTGMRTDMVDLDEDYTWFTIHWEVWGDYTHD